MRDFMSSKNVRAFWNNMTKKIMSLRSGKHFVLFLILLLISYHYKIPFYVKAPDLTALEIRVV